MLDHTAVSWLAAANRGSIWMTDNGERKCYSFAFVVLWGLVVAHSCGLWQLVKSKVKGFNYDDLVREAKNRWLKPAEVFSILQNHENLKITHVPPEKPPSGSLFLFNKRVLRFFRKDGHRWRRKKDGRAGGEAHERLKVGNVEALNCYYAHGEQNPKFQRRSYWMLDPAYEHIVFVHYRDISQGRQKALSMPQLSPVSFTINESPSPYSAQYTSSTAARGGYFEAYSSSGSMEISSFAVTSSGTNHSSGTVEEDTSPYAHEISEALRRIEEELYMNDGIAPLYNTIENSAHVDNIRDDHHNSFNQIPEDSNCDLLQRRPGDLTEYRDQLLGHEVNLWNMDDGYGSSVDGKNILLARDPVETPESVSWLNFNGDFRYPTFWPEINTDGSNPDQSPTLFDQDQNGISIAQKQKFRIADLSPNWGYADEATKVIIIGYFLCDPSESEWMCMFGDIEVPVQIIQEGVLCCHAPPHLPDKVTLCITMGNQEPCSEGREFEYRVKSTGTAESCLPETQCTSKNTEELLLLVRFAKMLLSDGSRCSTDSPESGNKCLEKVKASEELWGEMIDTLLVGNSTSSLTVDWLLQELLKDKLQQWLSSKLQGQTDLSDSDCVLSRKEQGVIHMIAGLGFEWGLQPILDAGVTVNFRDINGWTALHWAARFGREKMVAALIASGASAGAVTDATKQDPIGQSPADIAAMYGHKGLAGYLSEVALTTHLNSLTLEESELAKGAAEVEAERTIGGISETGATTNEEDQLSLNDTLAAARNATQAAAPLAIQKKYRGWKGRKDFLAFRRKVVKIQAHVRGYQVRKEYRVCWATGILEKVVLRWRRRGVGLRGFHLEIDESDGEAILKVFRKQKVDAAIDEAVSRVLSMVESQEARNQYRRILEKYRQAKILPYRVRSFTIGTLLYKLVTGNKQKIMKNYKLINGKPPPPFESDRIIGGVNIATVSPDHHKSDQRKVSLILKLKDGLNHPFRSLRGFIAGIFKGPVKPPILNVIDDDEKPANGKQKQDASPLPLSGPAISRFHY
nr:calmodulin-binding transcription activator 4-like isoform X1 [Ipomoea batatas]